LTTPARHLDLRTGRARKESLKFIQRLRFVSARVRICMPEISGKYP
jgi:hypothetical protein